MVDFATMEAGPELDALVADALGWRAWVERRGEYSLCVVCPPGGDVPWKRSRGDKAERYVAMTCPEAQARGFFGTGFPRFSTEIDAAWLVVEKMRQRGHRPLINAPAAVEAAWHCCFAVGDDYTHEHGDTAPLAICRAALVAVATGSGSPPSSGSRA